MAESYVDSIILFHSSVFICKAPDLASFRKVDIPVFRKHYTLCQGLQLCYRLYTDGQFLVVRRWKYTYDGCESDVLEPVDRPTFAI